MSLPLRPGGIGGNQSGTPGRLASALPNLRVDGFELPVAPSRRDRESLRFFEEHGKVFKENTISGKRELLERPRVSGWVSEKDLHSVQVTQLPDTFDEIDALIPLPREQNLDAAMQEGAGDLANMLLEDVGAGLTPWATCHRLSGGCTTCLALKA